MRKRISKTKVASSDNDPRMNDEEWNNFVYRIFNKKNYAPGHYYNRNKPKS